MTAKKKQPVCTTENVPEALDYVVKTQTYSYQETLFRLPEKQKMLLIALAKNGPATKITSADFVRRYALPSTSTVQSAVKGLLEKDFVTVEQGVYSVYDLFFAVWIQREY